MPGYLFSFPVKNIRSVVDASVAVQFRHAAGNEKDPVLPCRSCHSRPAHPVFTFRVDRKIFCAVGAAEHFRQNCEISAFSGGFPDVGFCELQAGFFFCLRRYLNECDFHRYLHAGTGGIVLRARHP